MIALPKRARPATNADINIVPYIDVMLVLLVIFMMTTPIIEQGVEVDLPKAPGVIVELDPNQMRTVISIDKDGNYYINSSLDPGVEEPDPIKAVSIKVIANTVIARRGIYPDMKVYVRQDEETSHYSMIQLISALGYFAIQTSLEQDTELEWVEELGIMVENVNL